MTTMRRELHLLSRTLVWRGASMLVLGIVAMIWPEPLLVPALLVAGLVAALLGVYEIAIAASIRRFTRAWYGVLVHGLASLSFACLTVGISTLSFRTALALTSGWLMVYAGLMWSGAVIMWTTQRPSRWALVACGLVDGVIAIFVVAVPAVAIFGFLFFGALYAAAFGAWQLALGVWLGRNEVRIMIEHVSAKILPRAQPTISAGLPL